MYNTGRLVVFFRVVGEGVEGAFVKVCEAAYVLFPLQVVNKVWQGDRFGSEGYYCKNDLNTNNFSRRTSV